MNYYIQGDAANAERIKAAFEKLGYDVKNWRFTTGVYYSLNGRIVNTSIGSNEYKLILNNPDYKELELPERKFKVGDWVVTDYGKVSQVVSVDNAGDGYTLDDGVYFSGSWCDMYHRWSIADAKDGDVICTYECGEPKIVFILRGNPEGNCSVLSYYFYYNIMYPHFEPNAERGCLAPKREDVKPATIEQRDMLFSKMKEAGYTWDEEKKELHKIKHYDISNFSAGMPVLVRDGDCGEWKYVSFSHYRKAGTPFCAGGQHWFQCIPFNEKTKHLLGTTDMPSEEYINW